MAYTYLTMAKEILSERNRTWSITIIIKFVKCIRTNHEVCDQNSVSNSKIKILFNLYEYISNDEYKVIS